MDRLGSRGLQALRGACAVPSRSLAAKLILSCEVLILAAGGISWFALIQSGREVLLNEVIKSAGISSDLLKSGIHYEMWTQDREAIQKIVEKAGAAEEIRSVRIFDSRGKIHYSNRKEEINHQVDRSSFACLGCHEDPGRPSETLTAHKRWVTYRGREGYETLTYVNPIYNEPSCATGLCHAHPEGVRVLGILEIDYSLLPLNARIRQQGRQISLTVLVLVALSSLTLYAILRKFVLAPVASLMTAMRLVARGERAPPVAEAGNDEIGLLTRTFNDMTVELQSTRGQMEQWTQTLEREVAKKAEDLRKSQNKLVQAEKLAALGRLTAEVAHEIRNPLTAIGGFAGRLRKIAAAGRQREYADVIAEETERLEKILREVLTFSRDARLHLEELPVEEVLHEIPGIFQKLCSEQNIAVDVFIDKDLPLVLIDRDQVRQAIMNLQANAIDAMPHGGTLRISAGEEVAHGVRYLRVSVSDTGQGIAPEDLELIFEPFFSTKAIGHGTGLGLSITRKIMEEHGGFVRAESTLQRGSTMSLFFPVQDAETSRGVKCWEYMQCGRDKDATVKCPAFPHFGRICWAVAGTFCEGKVQGTFAQKYADCRRCAFYQELAGARGSMKPDV